MTAASIPPSFPSSPEFHAPRLTPGFILALLPDEQRGTEIARGLGTSPEALESATDPVRTARAMLVLLDVDELRVLATALGEGTEGDTNTLFERLRPHC